MARTITSLTGYVRKIREVTPAPDEVLLYRGHSDRRSFKLLPSVLRKSSLADAEHAMLTELVASHPAEFASDGTTLEHLVCAQHYSLPTRLLDATWNPLVALFFAAKEHHGVTGEVIVFRVQKQHVKFHDSDTVSCIANLAHLKTTEKEGIDFTLIGDAFNNQPHVQRLLQFIKVEKPHFRSAIVPDHLMTVVCVKPKQNSQRILAQVGAFLLFGIFQDLDSHTASGILVERIHVNGNKKKGLLDELDVMAINESTMFPEIEKAAQYIRSKFTVP